MSEDTKTSCRFCNGRGKVPSPAEIDKFKRVRELTKELSEEFAKNPQDEDKVKFIKAELKKNEIKKFLHCVCVQEQKMRTYLDSCGYGGLGMFFRLDEPNLKKLPDEYVYKNLFVVNKNDEKFGKTLTRILWRRKRPRFVMFDAYRTMEVNLGIDHTYGNAQSLIHSFDFFVIRVATTEMETNKRQDYFRKFLLDLQHAGKGYWIVSKHPREHSSVSKWYSGESYEELKKLKLLKIG